MKQQIVFIIACILAAAGVVSAGPTKTYDGMLLSIPPTPAAAGIAGALTALGNDIHSLAANPAGMLGIPEKVLLLSHSDHGNEVTLEYAGFCLPEVNLNGLPVKIGLDATVFNSGSIDETQIVYRNYKAMEERLGTYRNADIITGIYYAFSPFSNFNFGIGTRYILSRLGGQNAGAFRFNFGMQKQFIRGKNIVFAIGGEVRNIGSALTYDAETDDPPLIYRLGGGMNYLYSFGELKLEVDLEFIKGDKANIYGGAAVILGSSFTLKSGYDSRNDVDNCLTFGLGFNLPFPLIGRSSRIDYAFIPYGDLENMHSLSLTTTFGR